MEVFCSVFTSLKWTDERRKKVNKLGEDELYGSPMVALNMLKYIINFKY